MKLTKLLLFAFTLTLVSCSIEPVNSDVYIYFDITEGLDDKIKKEYIESVPQIFNYMMLDRKKGYGKIQISCLNYEYFEKPIRINFSKIGANENKILSTNKINKFKTSVSDTIQHILNIPIDQIQTNTSIIYRHIFTDIERIKSSNSDKKLLVIFSDMLEHNPDLQLSMINKNIVKKNFEAFKKKMEQNYNIDMHDAAFFDNIEIHIVRPDHEKYREQRLNAEEFCRFIFGNSCSFNSLLEL